MTYSWILDSGGAGRGAWQGGVIYEFMRWARANDCYPDVTMGASAGGYAAADVATGTELTVWRGWTRWGKEALKKMPVRPEHRSFGGMGKFRQHLHASLDYVMSDTEVAEVFGGDRERKLLIFTTRVRRFTGEPISSRDGFRLFLKSATRKLPQRLKYFPNGYIEEPVIFATHVPPVLESEYVRLLTPANYHRVIEASCTIPFAMGAPLRAVEVSPNGPHPESCPNDDQAVFVDGGYTLKMPMALFQEDERFRALAGWARTDKTIIFCCDPKGNLWENSSRLRRLNDYPSVRRAVDENRLLIVYPDHEVEAGFLCLSSPVTMRTFERGREQGRRLLHTDEVKRFFDRDSVRCGGSRKKKMRSSRAHSAAGSGAGGPG